MATGDGLQQFGVTNRLCALGEQDPIDGRLGVEQVKMAQVAQQEQRPFGTATGELRGLLARPCEQSARWFGVGRVDGDPVALAERGERLEVRPVQGSQGAAEVIDVVVGAVAFADASQFLRELRLRVADVADRETDLHARIRSSTRADASPRVCRPMSRSGRDAVVVGAGAVSPPASEIFETCAALTL